MGFTTWAMVEYEADDALGAAAAVADADPRVDAGDDRARPTRISGSACAARVSCSTTGARARSSTRPPSPPKFGVGPASIADYLALVGDSADGYPGLPGWGAKSAATVLAKFGSISDIPPSSGEWGLPRAARRGEAGGHAPRQPRAGRCCSAGSPRVETDVEVGTVDDWHWQGPTEGFAAIAERARRAASGRAGQAPRENELTPAG